MKAVQRGDYQSSIDNFSSAIAHTNGRQDNYWQNLSQVYLFRINEELQRTDLSQEELGQAVTPLISNAINSAKMATEVSPQNVANWTVRGFVYRNLINLISGAEDWAIKSYQKAIELEPANPYIYTELGRVYSAKKEMDKAKEQFQKALALKPDYGPAHFQIAMGYVQEGKTEEAIKKLEEACDIAPFDEGLAFQLGLLYYNNEQLTKAQEKLERTISLNPNYSNARYFLGLVYDKKGKKDLAIEQFEKIFELNPDNEEVKQILTNLRGGKAALEGITPAQPPIEEKPEEQPEK